MPWRLASGWCCHHPVQLTAPVFPANGLEHSGTFHPSPLVNLCHSTRQGTNYSLKTTRFLQSQPRATPPPESRGPLWCVPPGMLTTGFQRTARSPSGHVLTPQPIYFCAGQTFFPLLLCRVSPSLLCIMQLENVVACFSVACMNSFILILNRFPTLLRIFRVGVLKKKMQRTMKSNY